MVCYEEVCVAADLPSLTLSRESHDFTTFLTSWLLISHAFSKDKLRKNFAVVGFVSKLDIASSIHWRKRLAVAFDYILFAYRDLPLPPNEQTYCFSFKMTANKTGKLQKLNRKIDRDVYCCSFKVICDFQHPHSPLEVLSLGNLERLAAFYPCLTTFPTSRFRTSLFWPFGDRNSTMLLQRYLFFFFF